MANNNSVLAIAQLLGRHSFNIIQWADSEFATKSELQSASAVTRITEQEIDEIVSQYDEE